MRARSGGARATPSPAAGSDLASLKTKAERFTADDGKEYYLVNGQKTWTTLAQFADWGFFLVRTDPTAKPQAEISFLLIDAEIHPGVAVAHHHPGGRPRGQRRLPRQRQVCRSRTASFMRTRAGPAPRPCCCTSAPASQAWRAPSVGSRNFGRCRARSSPTTPDHCSRRPGFQAQGRQNFGDRPDRPGIHRACAPWRGEFPARGRGAGPSIPEDQGHRDPAAAHRTGPGGRRPLRRPLSARPTA